MDSTQSQYIARLPANKHKISVTFSPDESNIFIFLFGWRADGRGNAQDPNN
jgi:hypothetical protein